MMTAKVSYDEVEVGTVLPAQTFQVQRQNLVMYAGASGDFNVIHWNERVAKAVGLPNVIAHGMFTMAEAGRVVTDWAGDPGAVVDYGVRFSAPVPVPDDDKGTTLEVSGTVAEKLDGNRVAVDLEARAGDSKVLSKARAVVQLA
jgi:acyl dehydratase